MPTLLNQKFKMPSCAGFPVIILLYIITPIRGPAGELGSLAQIEDVVQLENIIISKRQSIVCIVEEMEKICVKTKERVSQEDFCPFYICRVLFCAGLSPTHFILIPNLYQISNS